MITSIIQAISTAYERRFASTALTFYPHANPHLIGSYGTGEGKSLIPRTTWLSFRAFRGRIHSSTCNHRATGHLWRVVGIGGAFWQGFSVPASWVWAPFSCHP